MSPSSQSIIIDVNGGLLDAEDLSTLNPNCSTLASGDLYCTIDLNPPLGKDVFAIALWDSSAANAQTGQGNILSTGSFDLNVNGTAQAATIDFKGVVRSISLVPSEDYIPLSMSQLTVPEVVQLAVTALDADGNQITDPSTDLADYNSPILISDRDTSGETVLQTTSGGPPIPGVGSATVTVPNGATSVYALYNGGFIRADGFDPTSADVTDPTKLSPAGLAFDCMGGTGQFSPTAVRAAKIHPSARAFRGGRVASVPAGAAVRRRPSDLTGGQGGVYYDPAILNNCSYYYGYNCGMASLAPGECVNMPVEWDTGNTSDTLEWNVSSSNIITTTFNPPTTGSPGTTCVSFYAPPPVAPVSGLLQINASTPWFGGQLNHPLEDIGYSVATALSIDPSTYLTQRMDC